MAFSSLQPWMTCKWFQTSEPNILFVSFIYASYGGGRIYSKFYHGFFAVILDLYTDQGFQQTCALRGAAKRPLHVQCEFSLQSSLVPKDHGEKKPTQPSTSLIHQVQLPLHTTITLTHRSDAEKNLHRETTLAITQVEKCRV